MTVFKKIGIACGVIALLAVLLGLVVLIPFLRGPPEIELRVDDGMVEVLQGAWHPAITGMALKQGDAIRTKEGKATVIFFGANLLRLDANTEVKLTAVDEDEAKVIIAQSSGRTWNRVIKAQENTLAEAVNLKGIRYYELELPTAVATVRGTAFATDAKGMISVVHGKVAVTKGEEEKLVEQATAIITEKISVVPLQKDAWIAENQKKDDEFDTGIIAKIREKYWFLIKIAKEKGMTDEQIDQGIRDYLAGRITDEQLSALEEAAS